jgi:hypothetical protein
VYNNSCTLEKKTQAELQQRLRELGWVLVGPDEEDPRYNVWQHPRRARKLWVPGHDIVNPYTADRILADAAR